MSAHPDKETLPSANVRSDLLLFSPINLSDARSRAQEKLGAQCQISSPIRISNKRTASKTCWSRRARVQHRKLDFTKNSCLASCRIPYCARYHWSSFGHVVISITSRDTSSLFRRSGHRADTMCAMDSRRFFNHLEGADRAPVDSVASDLLRKFDADGAHTVWQKALARRHTDPDGAITSARTLLETVCKRILDESKETYSDKDDLRALYRAVSLTLQLAPSQYTEEAFRCILGGATSVVEALGSLRNKIGDAHGQGGKPVRPSPRHAHLAVDLAGAMATFLVDTWIARNQQRP
jgi:hypothetical protein